MATLDDVMAALKRIEAKVDALSKRPATTQATAAPVTVADDGEDETIAKDPPQWTKRGNPAVAPCRLSEGPLDWLEAVASFADWQAGKDDASGAVTDQGKPKSFFARRRAARARGWKERLPPPVTTQTDLLDEIPF